MVFLRHRLNCFPSFHCATSVDNVSNLMIHFNKIIVNISLHILVLIGSLICQVVDISTNANSEQSTTCSICFLYLVICKVLMSNCLKTPCVVMGYFKSNKNPRYFSCLDKFV